MRKLLLTTLLISALLPLPAAGDATDKDEKPFYISGMILESITKRDLTDAVVYRLESLGNPADSCKSDKGSTYRNGESAHDRKHRGLHRQGHRSIPGPDRA